MSFFTADNEGVLAKGCQGVNPNYEGLQLDMSCVALQPGKALEPNMAQDIKFVSVNSCSGIHMEQYSMWTGSENPELSHICVCDP